MSRENGTRSCDLWHPNAERAEVLNFQLCLRLSSLSHLHVSVDCRDSEGVVYSGRRNRYPAMTSTADKTLPKNRSVWKAVLAFLQVGYLWLNSGY